MSHPSASQSDLLSLGALRGSYDGSGNLTGILLPNGQVATLASLSPASFQARLTLVSGTPVPQADTTASSVILTPDGGNVLSLYDSALARWGSYALASELSLALTGLTTGLNYDVFVTLASGAPALSALVPWTSATARATALQRLDGRLCLTGDRTKLYAGTFTAASATTTTDSKARRLLWNAYNRRRRVLRVEATASHTVSTAGAYRYWGNSAANRLDFTIGWLDDSPSVPFTMRAQNTGSNSPYAVVGVKLNANNVAGDRIMFVENGVGGNAWQHTIHGAGTTDPIVGSNYLALVQQSDASVTFNDATIEMMLEC